MLFVALCLAYALGCLSPGWWLARHRAGVDLRQAGSGGTGATNAARVLGQKMFGIVLLLDVAKAIGAVLVARWLAPANAWWALALPAVVAGHIWPAPLRFQGGRGAGPLLGGCLALNPMFAVAAAVPAMVVSVFTHRRIVITTTAAASGIACAWWLLPLMPARVAFGLAVAMVILAHRTHFMRTMHGSVP